MSIEVDVITKTAGRGDPGVGRTGDPSAGPAGSGVRPDGRGGPPGTAAWLLALLLGVSLAPTACVTYVPVEVGAVPAGEEVRVRLTDEGAIRAARHLGRIRTQLDAGVEPLASDSIRVTVWLGKNYPGTAFENVRERMILPRSEVRDLHLRRLSVPRTAAALAGAGVVFALLVDRIFLQEDPNGVPPDDDDNPPPAGLTLLSIPIGSP